MKNITYIVPVCLVLFSALECSSEVNNLLTMGMHLNTELLTYEKCSNEGNGVFYFEGRHSRKNRTLVVENSNFTLNVPFDTSIKVKVSIAIWGNGGWRPNGFVLNLDKGCQDILNILGEEVAEQLFTHTRPKIERKCPIKAGHYVERDMDVAMYNKLQIPRFIPGKWRMDVMFIRKSDDELLGCFRREVLVSYKKN